MQDILLLKEKLVPHGDIREIAIISGYNVSYVRKVLEGERYHKKIIDIAYELIQSRINVRRKFDFVSNKKNTDQYESIERLENLVFNLQLDPLKQIPEIPSPLLAHIQESVSPSLYNFNLRLQSYSIVLQRTLNWFRYVRVKFDCHFTGILLQKEVEQALINLSDIPEGIKIDFPEDNSDIAVSADPGLLGIALRGLLYHLIKNTRTKGRISIKIGEQARNRVYVKLISHHCLINPGMFVLLKESKSVGSIHSPINTFESVAIASHFIMAMHHGHLRFSTIEDQQSVITLIFQ
jgi:signal transduction histidine kinase